MKFAYLWPYVLRPLFVVLVAALLFKLAVEGGGRMSSQPSAVNAGTAVEAAAVPAVADAAEPAGHFASLLRARGRDLLLGGAAGVGLMWLAAAFVQRRYRALLTSLHRLASEVRFVAEDQGRKQREALDQVKAEVERQAATGAARVDALGQNHDRALAELAARIEALSGEVGSQYDRRSAERDQLLAGLDRVAGRLGLAAQSMASFVALPPPVTAPVQPVAAAAAAPHLVFHGRSVPWSALWADRDEHPRLVACVRRSGGADEVVAPVVDGDSLRFAASGTYCLTTSFGDRRVLVLDSPAGSDGATWEIMGFLAAAMVTGERDFPAYAAGGPDAIAARLFVGVETAVLPIMAKLQVMSRVLAREGVLSRLAILEPNAAGLAAGHCGYQMLEVFLYGSQRWALIDPHLNLAVETAAGQPLSLADVLAGGQEWRARPFAPLAVFKPAHGGMPDGLCVVDAAEHTDADGIAYPDRIRGFVAYAVLRAARLEAGGSDWLSSTGVALGPDGKVLAPDEVQSLFSGHDVSGDQGVAVDDIAHVAGHCFRAEIPALAAEGDSIAGLQQSRWMLVEDGHVLARSHSLHDTIRLFGRGRYSHWQGKLYFAASDNSDPRSNGRAYRLVKQEDTASDT